MKLRFNKKLGDERKNNKKINKDKSPKKSNTSNEVRISLINIFLNYN